MHYNCATSRSQFQYHFILDTLHLWQYQKYHISLLCPFHVANKVRPPISDPELDISWKELNNYIPSAFRWTLHLIDGYIFVKMPLFLKFWGHLSFCITNSLFQTYSATWQVDGGHNRRMPKTGYWGSAEFTAPLSANGWYWPEDRQWAGFPKRQISWTKVSQ